MMYNPQSIETLFLFAVFVLKTIPTWIWLVVYIVAGIMLEAQS